MSCSIENKLHNTQNDNSKYVVSVIFRLFYFELILNLLILCGWCPKMSVLNVRLLDLRRVRLSEHKLLLKASKEINEDIFVTIRVQALKAINTRRKTNKYLKNSYTYFRCIPFNNASLEYYAISENVLRNTFK